MVSVVGMIADRGMDGGEFMQSLNVSEPRHHPFPLSKGLMCVIGSIAELTLDLLASLVADHLHRSPV